MMNNIQQPTICAISTPAGVGGIAVARVSGRDAVEIVEKIWQGKNLELCQSHTAHLGTVTDTDGRELDQAVAVVYRAPRSFTGEDVVELSVHGSIYVQRELIASLIKAGAQLAQPGEFTRRAFAAGKFDLAQAEAVADVIASSNRAAHRLAVSQMRGGVSKKLAMLREKLLEIASLLELELDFSEEDVQFASREKLLEIARTIECEIMRLLASFRSGSAIREGIPVAIAGATNVGKSSLLNAIVGDERAIVSDVHGTTRDLVEDTVILGDYQFRFIDTAGLRHTDDRVEAIGIDRARNIIERARIVLLVLDASNPNIPADVLQAVSSIEAGTALVACINKCDVASPEPIKHVVTEKLPDAEIVEMSVLEGQGVDSLKQLLCNIVARDIDMQSDNVLITNARHSEALTAASESVRRVIQGLLDGISGDFIAQDLRDTLHHLAEITGGEITTPTILATIFSRFCIGK